ncbi:ferredoxin [Kitasatospora sp. GP82]|uniref:ferredoxin n=1 Tax=Kitasatospora sp. GP82 TaxID=3035089 RepID=UPI00247370B2|nr:ferredoxin [Kitasatospora sp. GP82]MDH6128862.1 ferredoxin [Kitasatospora sp. GP82]
MSAAEPELIVTVDRTRCVGTGACTGTAPDDLELGPDGRARALRPASTARDELTEAAEMCPVEAITVHFAHSGEQVAPLY